MAVANEWLFGPLLVKQAGASPAGAALLHTTIAPTMLKGSPKENVLPQDATAWINYRIAPGDTSATVMARAKAAVGDLPVTLAWNAAAERALAGLLDHLLGLEGAGRHGRGGRRRRRWPPAWSPPAPTAGS